MANSINTTSGTKQSTGTGSGKYVNPSATTRSKDINLNDPSKAAEFFALKADYILSPAELYQYIQDRSDFVNIIDVRRQEDYVKGHILGAINLPPDQWKAVAALKKDKLNIVYCYSLECPLAAKAAAQFAGQGFSVMELVGGYEGWEYNHLETETKVHH